MKKAVKALAITAAVAAVAGIGAVSFAQWQQGSSAPATVEGNVGSIVTIGSLSASHDLGSKKLVPYDQVDQYNETTMAQAMNITLSYTGGTGEGAVITMTASGTLASKLEWEKTTGTWVAFNEGVTVEAGNIKIRLNSSTTSDMGQDYTITFTVAAPTV
ncbi:MAG: hypothetical protein J1G04_05310 [Clostridiales bacterium]|nr:hypothetical protein [Clostridiales bacterium]